MFRKMFRKSFKGFRWYDLLLGILTGWLWILWKLGKNNISLIDRIVKIITIFLIVFIAIGIIINPLSNDKDEFNKALKTNNIARMKIIVNDNPDLMINGQKAKNIIDNLEIKQKIETQN